MPFPTPAGHGETETETRPTKPNPDDEPEPEPRPGEEEPTFGDDMSRRALLAAIEEYQEWVAASDKYPVDVDLSDIPTELSNQMKKTAGKVCHVRGSSEVKYIRYAYKAYQKWGWEKFAETIRHELIHVHTVQNYTKGGHGRLFKNLVGPMETHRFCEKFASDEAKYHLFCEGCGQQIGERFRASAVTKNPERYNTKCCQDNIRVKTT